MAMLFCRRRISGSKAAASPVDASVTMAISGSMPSAAANASYQAAYHCGCWNGVGGLVSFQRAAAAFQSRINSTRNPDARALARASSFPTLVVSVVIAMVRLRGLLQIDELAGLGGVE